MAEIALRPVTSRVDQPASIEWVAAILIAVATAMFSISNLLWTVREGVPPLSANSEFFAYSWIYALRWGAGENVFMPHSQLLFPIFALINKVFGMSAGSAGEIIAGWHRIALIWPIVLMAISIGLITLTLDRTAPLADAVVSSGLFLVSVPLFLTDHALNSTSYHSLSIPLALAALPFWRAYRLPNAAPPISFYLYLGIYTAACLLGKPTFGAFAAPFFAMEIVRSIRNRNAAGLLLAIATAIIAYLGALLAFYGSIHGVAGHFSKSSLFMRSQAGWYDAEKGATPLHWYAGYVIGKMGPLPSALIAIALAAPFVRRDRAMLLTGVATAIACALFCLYIRSQLHAQPEFIALVMTAAIASFRCSGAPGMLQARINHGALPLAAGAAAVVLTAWTAAFPPATMQHGQVELMAAYDRVIVPVLFLQPAEVRTVALIESPAEQHTGIMWGVTDAWCRGQGNIFDLARSDLLDRKFGNITCLSGTERDGVDLSSYNRVVFLRDTKDDQNAPREVLAKVFPRLVSRFADCATSGDPLPSAFEARTFDLMVCGLRSAPLHALRD
jgi:hypothetical protein